MKYFNFKKIIACPAKLKRSGGFTLVEMMVAIAVFSMVMVTATSALLNVIDANNKAISIKTAINNITFALEGISKDMRVGSDYSCYDSISSSFVGSCPSGGSYIQYRSQRADLGVDNKRKLAYYKIEEGQIKECIQKGLLVDCSNPLDFKAITSIDVHIDDTSKFYILGTGMGTQPRMIVVISGSAGSKEKTKTYFDLQTGVSQVTRVKTTL